MGNDRGPFSESFGDHADAASERCGRERIPPRDAVPRPTSSRAGPSVGLTRRAGPDASGSGFIVSPDGYIVTNRHVVNGCQSVSVRADSSTGFKAQVVALHAHDDLAVIRADATFGGVAAFRVGAAIRPGDDIVAVGFHWRVSSPMSRA
jgi:S1-C subfamily serine protease